MIQGKQVANTGIVWSLAGSGTCTTWADVLQRLSITPSPQPIVIDPFTIPPNTPYVVPSGTVDLHGASFGMPSIKLADAEVIVSNGAVLRNLSGGLGGGIQNGLTVVGQGSAPIFDWDHAMGAPVGSLTMSAAAVLRNDGTAPMVSVPTGAFFIFAIVANAVVAAPAHGQPIVALNPSSVMIFTSLATLTTDAGSTLDPSWVTGDMTTAMVIQHDDGFDFSLVSTWTGFAGVVLNFPLGFNGGSGPTAFRPSSFSGSIPSGMSYFDTSLGMGGIPIWWSEFHGYWIDATGAGPQ